MTDTIMAIETIYNGYRFRSRLEARWAVFFDEAQIRYEYEPEGFDIPDVGYYLPDFYLPQFRSYAEVKPLSVSKDEEAETKRKLRILFYGKYDINTILLKGDPVDMNLQIYANDANDESGGEGWWSTKRDGMRFMLSVEDGLPDVFGDPCIMYVNTREHDIYTSGWCRNEWIINTYGCSNTFYPLNKAAIKARQARFEHGECPEAAS
jgi:hypothetical protein